MEIFGETIERELPDLARQGVRTRFIGRRDRAPDELREQIERLERRDRAGTTASTSGSPSTTAAAQSIVEAARRLVEDGVAAGRRSTRTSLAREPLRAGAARP